MYTIICSLIASDRMVHILEQFSKKYTEQVPSGSKNPNVSISRSRKLNVELAYYSKIPTRG